MADRSEPVDRLGEALHAFMPGFVVHLHPLLHRTTHRDRSYSALEVIVVLGLATFGPLRPVELSRGLAIEKGSLTSVIRRLEAVGVIEREAVVGDARGYVISLTAAGRDLVDHLAEQRRSGLRTLFDGLPAKDATAAANGLEVLTSYFRDRPEHPAG